MQREGWQSGWWVVCAPRGIQCKKNHTWIFNIPFRIQFLNSNWSQFPWITHKNWKRVRMFTSWLTYFCGNPSASKEWLKLNNKFIEMEICTLRINLVHLFSKITSRSHKSRKRVPNPSPFGPVPDKVVGLDERDKPRPNSDQNQRQGCPGLNRIFEWQEQRKQQQQLETGRCSNTVRVVVVAVILPKTCDTQMMERWWWRGD